MAVFQSGAQQGYTVRSNHHLRIRSYPKGKRAVIANAVLAEDWDYTLAGLSFINREKIDAIGKPLRNWNAPGLIVRSRERDEKGRLRGADYVIFEQPQTRLYRIYLHWKIQHWINPTLEKPTQKKTYVGKSNAINKDIQKTNLPKKEKIK